MAVMLLTLPIPPVPILKIPYDVITSKTANIIGLCFFFGLILLTNVGGVVFLINIFRLIKGHLLDDGSSSTFWKFIWDNFLPLFGLAFALAVDWELFLNIFFRIPAMPGLAYPEETLTLSDRETGAVGIFFAIGLLLYYFKYYALLLYSFVELA
jgi:hypothetical protein